MFNKNGGGVDDGLVAAWQSSRRMADEAITVVDEFAHLREFRNAVAQAVDDPEIVGMYRDFVKNCTTSRSRDDWVDEFRRVGFRQVFEGKTLPTVDAPSDPIVLWRLAADWREGLSWSADPRFCHSYPWIKYQCHELRLWTAVVPADAVLGVCWYGGAFGGGPMLRTVDSAELGRVRIAVDDYAEWIVDPGSLDESRVIEFNSFGRRVPPRLQWAMDVDRACTCRRGFGHDEGCPGRLVRPPWDREVEQSGTVKIAADR
ncbi:hypothetical protein [Gordonia sp. OPL2]|uniref:hypothetical protein n=1 Tax=Gordonia sp. OPL2 TaxID=2486274 RepID=UPI001655D44E|nr:hypothetical protein [Gordonia sp. OPL2]RPA12623.1 hypothetical protein EEB19_05075 [Gordonia sp. OPL2]